MFTAEKIINAFAKVYHEKVVPRIQQKAINEFKEENPLSQPLIFDESSNNKENNLTKLQERLTKFMEQCDVERKAFIAQKEEEEARKLEKILLYTRK